MRRTVLFMFLVGAILSFVAGCGGGGSGCPPGNCSVQPSNDPGDVFRQCGPVDIVIVMDTSGSMDDEAEALCGQIEQVIAELTGFGLTDLRLLKWGVTADADDFNAEFTCLTENVRDVFDDPEFPGMAGQFFDDSESDEEWAPAVAVVSHLGSADRHPGFQWRSGAIRIMIPISDMDPDPRDDDDTSQDRVVLDNAINFATANQVIVAPIIANEAEVFASEYALEIAEATGGIASRSADTSTSIGELIYDIVFVSCGGQIDPPAQPGSPGPTMLVAAGRDGGLFSLNTGTGAATFLVGTPVEGGGTGDVLNYVSSMIYNEASRQLWAGVGGNGNYYANVFRISGNGTATFLVDNYDESGSWIYAHPGMAQDRATQAIFGMSGDDNLLLAVNNQTGLASIYAYDVPDIDAQGNALTFVGNRLFLAAEEELWELDTFSGAPTSIGELGLSGFPANVADGFRVLSMTTRPSDNRVFGILRADDDNMTYLCTINVSTGLITNIGPTRERVDGITWVPSGYFAGS